MPQTPEEKRAYQKAWWEANRGKAAEYRKQWRIKNPARAKEINSALKKKHADRIRTYNREYYHRNKEKVRVWNNHWRKENPEKYKASHKNSRKNHPETAINSKANRRARERGKLTKGLKAALMIAQNGLCNSCKFSFSETPHMDHIIPLSKGGRHEDANMQLLCRRCNQSKGSKLLPA